MSKPPLHFLQFAARHWALLLAMCFGSTLAHIATTGMPLQVGALMDGTSRTASEVGLYAFVEVGSLALGMILLSLLLAKIQPVRIAVTGAVLASLAYTGLYFAREFWIQLVLGGFAGLGFGMVYSANIAAGASVEDADRAYGVGFGGSLLLVVSIMTLLPFTSTRFGLLGIFACLAGFSLISTPILFGFKEASAVTKNEAPPTRHAVWRIQGAPGLLFSWAAFSAGTAMAYVFAERIGRNLHLPPTQIGLVLSSGVFVGLLGTTSAALFGQRLNRRVALIVGLAGSALACFLIGNATSLFVFTLGIWLFWIFPMFLYCYLLGTAAILDNTGRPGTFGSGTERLGYAVGSWISGLLAQHVSYSSTGTLGCAVCLVGLILGYPPLFRALSRRDASARAATSQALS